MFVVLQRAFTSNLQQVSPRPAERTKLEARGIQNETLQAYLVWRRSLMMIVVISTILSAGLSTYRDNYEDDDRPNFVDAIVSQIKKHATAVLPANIPVESETTETAAAKDRLLDSALTSTDEPENDVADNAKQKKSLLGQIDDIVHLVSLYILPLAAIAVIAGWTRFGLTYRILVGAFAFSFLAPILLSFCPWSWWEPEAATEAASLSKVEKFERISDGLMEGINYLFMLLPTVLSLLPGVQKACVRVKSLLPQSTLPGWLLVAASPFYALFLLVICVAVNQVFGNPLLLIGLLLIVAASLIYRIRMDVFIRPLVTESDYRQMFAVQKAAGIMTLIAGCLLLYFIQSHDFLGIHLLGFDSKKAFLLPLDLLEFFLEIIGRSMFMTVFGADLFLRMNLIAWKSVRNFQGTPVAEQYDMTMSAIEQTP